MRRFTVLVAVPVAGLTAAVLTIALFDAFRVSERIQSETRLERLEREVRLLADVLPWNERGAALDRVCRRQADLLGARITVIDEDGAVLGDSEAPSASIENLGHRPEILDARRAGAGSATRFAPGAGEMILYVAAIGEDRGRRRVVRVAVPLRAESRFRTGIYRPLGYGLAATIVLAMGFGWLLSRHVAERFRRAESSVRRIVSGESVPDPEGWLRRSGEPFESVERQFLDLGRSIRAELAVAVEERARLEAVLRAMADGVVVVDVDGRIVLCNDSAVDLLRIDRTLTTRGEMLSAVSRDPDLLDLLEEVLVRGRAVVQREITLEGLDEPRHLIVNGAPMTDGESSFGAILALHDVTRMRQLERVRADFVANVSHELRTPLTAIRGYAETLLQGALDDPSRAVPFLEVIDRHARRLGRLIEDLLSLSDLELGRAELRRRPVAVSRLFEAVCEVIGPQATAAAIRLETDVGEDVGFLDADPDRMEEVLINLAENAVKYSKEGTTVTLRARRLGSQIEVAVIDHGIGIPQKDIPRLTERFYRVDRARSRELGGTGLGLAIVKHIVQAHGGSLSIESRVGEGTTVRVLLVAGRPDPAAPA